MRFHNKFRDYAKICSFGMLAGALSLMTTFLPAGTLWSFSTITTLYGFWIVTSVLLIWRSTSHLTAGLNVFLYLVFTTIAFYGLKYILGFFLPQSENSSFQFQPLLHFAVSAFVCGIAALILYLWNHKSWYGSILLAAPIGLLAAESLYTLFLLQQHQTHLFQMLFNAGFCLYLGIQFRKMAKSKEIYSVSVIGFAALSYYFIYV